MSPSSLAAENRASDRVEEIMEIQMGRRIRHLMAPLPNQFDGERSWIVMLRWLPASAPSRRCASRGLDAVLPHRPPQLVAVHQQRRLRSRSSAF